MTSKLHRYAPQLSKMLAELLIIVVGVLIALGIDEWRGRIADADLENVYLGQLIADLGETERKMAEASQVNVASLAAIESLLVAFESPDAAELGRLNQLILEIDRYDNPVPVLGTIEALVSTGDLRLIRNSAIRSALTRYLSRTRDYLLIPLYQYEEYHREDYFRVTMIAVEYGLTPKGRESKRRRNAEPDIGGFLANSEAYAATSSLAQTLRRFEQYRNDVTNDAKEFRQLVTSSLNPE